MASDHDVLTARPVMFRSYPVLFVVLVILTPVGIGVVGLVVWYLRCRGTSLQITSKRTILRHGLLVRRTREVRHSDVRYIEVRQTLFQRWFDTGQIAVSSSAQGEMEIVVDCLPQPDFVKQTIDSFRG